jgi:glycosyltransferase involved in cell wall biosynthesis
MTRADRQAGQDAATPGAGRDTTAGCAFVLPWDLREVGGVNEIVKNLFAEFERSKRYRPIVLINDAAHAVPSEQEVAGRHTIYLRIRPPWDRTAPLRNALAYLLSLPATLTRLWRTLRAHRITIINIHYPTLSAFTLVLLKALARPRPVLILSFHGLDVEFMAAARGIERQLWKAFTSAADRLVVCSEALRTVLLQALPGCEHKVHTVHNGLDLDRAGAELGAATFPAALQARRYILTVGAFEQKKGLDILLRAFGQIAQRDAAISLVLIGRRGPCGAQIRRMIREHSIERRVEVYENVPHGDVLAVMQQAQLFVLPSRREPFGITLLEAGAFRVPTVATRVGGIPEVVSHGETGLLVPAEDPDALAAGMSRLLDDPATASALAEAMHQRVASRFTAQSAYRKYEALIDGVAQRA